MMQTPRTTRASPPAIPFAALLIMPVLLAAIGCSPHADMRDQRLVEFADQSMTRQAQQNDHIAEQSKAVVKESHTLAQASKELVAQDAEARRELVAAQKELNTQLNEQRVAVDAGRDQLEKERREIARQRHREPIIAAAIQNAGLVIACLLPLLVCVFVIWQMRFQDPDDTVLAELLVQELVSDQPTFLPAIRSQPVALDDHTGSTARDLSVTDDATADDGLPS